jgi:hypothetical protein
MQRLQERSYGSRVVRWIALGGEPARPRLSAMAGDHDSSASNVIPFVRSYGESTAA